MAYSLKIKNLAKKLRKSGLSLKEISEKMSISKSTASAWLSPVKLGEKAKRRLRKRRIIGSYNAQQTKKKKRKKLLQQYFVQEKIDFKSTKMDKKLYKMFAALLFWCEGAKTQAHIEFINSDPKMIKLFLTLLRNSFSLDEKKFRVLMHLHGYHNEKMQQDFWSQVTQIPLSQFAKTYWKPNTGKRKRINYPGCIRVNYYDVRVARQLSACYNVLAQSLRGVR